MKKVALYARVSTEEQKKNYSIGEQIEQLKDYCNRNGWNVKEEYIDAGFSGANMNRPALKKLLMEVKDYDVIVVWKLDRLSRSIIDTMTIIERDLLEQGVQFVALAENINTDSSTWVTQAGIYSTIAQSEREAITERMQMGKLARAKSGKPMAWANAPFGYDYSEDRNSYDIIPLEADIVKKMFEEYDRIGSVTKLRDSLNEQGHVGKNVKWSYRTVKQVLENPAYKGYNRYKGEEFKGNQEPIISEELFEKTQRLMEERRIQAKNKFYSRPFQGKYMLAGQVECGYCGAPLQITQYQRKDGTQFRYICMNRTKKRLTATTIYNNGEKCEQSIVYKKDELEEYVVKEISKMQLDNDLILEYSQDTNKKMSTLKDYEDQLKDNQTKVKKIIDLYMAELITQEEMNERSKNLKSEERYLKNLIDEMKNENNAALNYLEEEPTNIIDMDYEAQKRTVEILIDKIAVKKDSIRIGWNF